MPNVNGWRYWVEVTSDTTGGRHRWSGLALLSSPLQALPDPLRVLRNRAVRGFDETGGIGGIGEITVVGVTPIPPYPSRPYAVKRWAYWLRGRAAPTAGDRGAYWWSTIHQGDVPWLGTPADQTWARDQIAAGLAAAWPDVELGAAELTDLVPLPPWPTS